MDLITTLATIYLAGFVLFLIVYCQKDLTSTQAVIESLLWPIVVIVGLLYSKP